MAVIDFSGVGLAKSKLAQVSKRLVSELKKLQKATYQSPYASLCVPNDRAILKVTEAAIHMKRKLNPSLVVVVGIGGRFCQFAATWKEYGSGYTNDILICVPDDHLGAMWHW